MIFYDVEVSVTNILDEHLKLTFGVDGENVFVIEHLHVLFDDFQDEYFKAVKKIAPEAKFLFIDSIDSNWFCNWHSLKVNLETREIDDCIDPTKLYEEVALSAIELYDHRGADFASYTRRYQESFAEKRENAKGIIACIYKRLNDISDSCACVDIDSKELEEVNNEVVGDDLNELQILLN